MAMKPEVKKMWIDALRSGEYEQCTGRLCKIGGNISNNRYCCLGVLTDLAIKNGVDIKKEEDGECIWFDDQSYKTPDKVVEWSGINQAYPLVIVDDKPSSLDAINDNGSTFEEIADLIEEQL